MLWEPILTAPTNRSFRAIIAYKTGLGDWFVGEAKYQDQNSHLFSKGWWRFDGEGAHKIIPSHWDVLPVEPAMES